MKPLSDQISRGQSFVHAQKTARDQFGDFNKTFSRPLRPRCDCHFFGRNAIASQSQAMCDRGFNQTLENVIGKTPLLEIYDTNIDEHRESILC